MDSLPQVRAPWQKTYVQSSMMMLEFPPLFGSWSAQGPLQMCIRDSYYISQVDTIDGRGYIRLLPYGPFETPEEEQIYVEIPINKEWLAGYDPRLEPAPAGKFTPSALMVGAGISATFEADKLLGIIFSKKMRAKARNAKEADAWKSY